MRAGLVPRLHPSPPCATSGEQSVQFALLSYILEVNQLIFDLQKPVSFPRGENIKAKLLVPKLTELVKRTHVFSRGWGKQLNHILCEFKGNAKSCLLLGRSLLI